MMNSFHFFHDPFISLSGAVISVAATACGFVSCCCPHVRGSFSHLTHIGDQTHSRNQTLTNPCQRVRLAPLITPPCAHGQHTPPATGLSSSLQRLAAHDHHHGREDLRAPRGDECIGSGHEDLAGCRRPGRRDPQELHHAALRVQHMDQFTVSLQAQGPQLTVWTGSEQWRRVVHARRTMVCVSVRPSHVMRKPDSDQPPASVAYHGVIVAPLSTRSIAEMISNPCHRGVC